MREYRDVFRKKIFFFIVNILIVTTMILHLLSSKLMPLIMEVGVNECNNMSTRIINHVVLNQVTQTIKDEIVIYSSDDVVSIDFNTAILNSIVGNCVKKMQYYFYMLKQGDLGFATHEFLEISVEDKKLKKGIMYEVPLSRVFDNVLIANMGIKIPVRYMLIGNVEGQIASTLKEYGINNALLQIDLQIKSKARITIPFLSKESEINVSVPLVMKLIQGDIPESFFGTSIIGEGV